MNIIYFQDFRGLVIEGIEVRIHESAMSWHAEVRPNWVYLRGRKTDGRIFFGDGLT